MMDMFSRRPGTRVSSKPFPMKEVPIDFNRMAEFLIKKFDLKNEMLVYDTMIQYEIT